MLSIVTKGVKEVLKAIENDKKQTRFASALALTRTAKQAAAVEQKLAKNQIDRPTPFTLRGIRFEKATPKKLESRVYIQPIQSEYLYWQIEGGTRRKRSKVGEAWPVNIRLNKYGNIPARSKGKLQKLMDQPNTFIKTIRGVKGLWQRSNRTKTGKIKPLKMLARFEPSIQYKPEFKFYEIAGRVFNKNFERQFDKALDYAMRTSR